VTDPTQPRPRGRHSGPDSDSGRQAAGTPSAWTPPGSDTLQVTGDPAEATMRPRRRRYAPDTDATGVQVLPPRAAIDVSDVGITGLDAAGIADVGLAAAGLDLSAFGIDRPATPFPLRRTGSARDVGRTALARPGDPATGAQAPPTTEMAVAPPAVPQLRDADRTARGQARDRRPAPAPRSASEPTTADRVAADRYAEAATDPGWLSATGRPAPTAAAPRGGARRAPPG
jgi:UPF0755 protein